VGGADGRASPIPLRELVTIIALAFG